MDSPSETGESDEESSGPLVANAVVFVISSLFPSRLLNAYKCQVVLPTTGSMVNSTSVPGAQYEHSTNNPSCPDEL